MITTTAAPAAPAARPGAAEDFAADVLQGLRRRPKRLPCKWLYDERGSELFERICTLDEYYLTRAELEIMHAHAAEMADRIGPGAVLVEFGSGAGVKTRLLLAALFEPAGYVPVEISPTALGRSAAELAAEFPDLPIHPLCADYTAEFALPVAAADAPNRTAYFPGSTIGNFEPAGARAFLPRVHALVGAGGGLLIGVDLKKDPARLHAAYNDAEGVTAEFNLNLLARINRELGGDFDPAGFAHYAFYNPRLGRMEMHLVSRDEQTVTVAGAEFPFNAGESILTEVSYKHTLDGFDRAASDAGFHTRRVWLDDEALFSVHYLTAG